MNYRTFFLVAFLLFAMLVLMYILNWSREQRKKQAIELNKFRLAVDNAYDHIVITSPDGVLLYGNKAVERITGYSLKEIINTKAGNKWGGLMPPDFYKRMWKVIAKDKKTFTGEIKNKRKNGEEYFSLITITPVLDEARQVLFYVGIERDISKEKELDQAKSDFISIASHQLRTPLTVIKGYISMMMEGSFGELAQTQSDILSKIYDSNEREINFVQDMLNMSRMESGRMSFTFAAGDVQELVASVADELSGPAQKKGLELRYIKPSGTLQQVNMDKDKLRQVMMNLVENSIKYTPAGFTQISLSDNGKFIRFEVADSGMGIKPEEMTALFAKYSRGSEDSSKTKTIKGTGLGLYVGKMIIEAHKGRIWAESEGENKGSKFIFELPVIKK